MRAIQALSWPDIWGEDLALAVDGHKFDLRGREYERAIFRDESKFIVVPKGAQLGFTTLFILKAAHAVVQRQYHVLYLLPLKAGSIQFVQGRIDPIIDSNDKLKAAFSRTDNRAQKQTKGGINWYIRGTNIETELREVPSDILILDERDKANEENLEDAYARLDGSNVARVYELSTPTIDGHGVYAEDGWASTDQMRWWVPCPYCSAKQVLTFDENVMPWLGDTVAKSQICCSHCHHQLTDQDRGEMNAGGVWVPDKPDAEKRGYHLSQFNSPTKQLTDVKLGILVNYFAGQTDSKKLKAFYNLSLGLPYAAPGDKFTPELLDRVRCDYQMGGIPDGGLFIGIDVGHDVLYVTIYTKTRGGQLRLWQLHHVTADATRKKWQVLDEEILSVLPNWICVSDAHPDKEEAEWLSKKYGGRFIMGFEKHRPDQHETANFLDFKYGDPSKVNIDRTMAFDTYIKRFLDGQVMWPRDARELGGRMPKLAYNSLYHQHLMMTRVEQADAQERMVAMWVNTKGDKGNKPDHWHHSGMFAFIASMKDAPLAIAPEIGEMFIEAGGIMAGAHA